MGDGAAGANIYRLFRQVGEVGHERQDLVRLAQALERGGVSVDGGGPAPGRGVGDMGLVQVHAGKELVVVGDGGNGGLAGVDDVIQIHAGRAGSTLGGGGRVLVLLLFCKENHLDDARRSRSVYLCSANREDCPGSAQPNLAASRTLDM